MHGLDLQDANTLLLEQIAIKSNCENAKGSFVFGLFDGHFALNLKNKLQLTLT